MNQAALNLYLVRHGETEANVDIALHLTKADHAMRLTARGRTQAVNAGAALARRLATEREAEGAAFGSIRLWHSPYYRARETAGLILKALAGSIDPAQGMISYREEPFLMEQKSGLQDGLTDEEFATAYPDAAAYYARHIQYNGRIYAISPMGESRMDVVVRVKHVFGTIIDDYRTHGIRHVILVNHGATLRACVMGWMRYSPEWLDAEKNPGNCWIRHLHGARASGYVDGGYIHGEGAPLGNPGATQRMLPDAGEIFMLRPDRPGTIVPHGVKVEGL